MNNAILLHLQLAVHYVQSYIKYMQNIDVCTREIF